MTNGADHPGGKGRHAKPRSASKAEAKIVAPAKADAGKAKETQRPK